MVRERLVEYADVSDDPSALPASRLSPLTLEAVRAHPLGFTELGWIMTRASGELAFVNHVSVSADRRTALTLTHLDVCGHIDVASAKTLLEDGTIVTTEQSTGLPASSIVAVMRRAADPAHRYRFAASKSRNVASLVAEHEARVASLATPGNHPVPIDLRAYVAMRRRWRELADADDAARLAACVRADAASIIVAAGAALAAAWRLHPIVVGRYGEEAAAVAAIAAVATGIAVGARIGSALVHWIAHGWSRFAPLPTPRAAPRDARELLALGDDLERDRIPVVGSPAPIRVAVNDLRALVRTDLAATVGASMLFPLAGLFSNVSLGVGGAFAALGVYVCADSAFVLVTGHGVTRLVRRALVPNLVEAELVADDEGDQARALVVPIALLRGIVGAVALAIARVLIVSRPPSYVPSPQANVVVLWLALAFVLATRAWLIARRRHHRIIPREQR